MSEFQVISPFQPQGDQPAAIDKLVYQLYGLSDEEIAIVEEATR